MLQRLGIGIAVTLAAVGMFLGAACSDDEETTATTTTTPPSECQVACTDLYNCAVAECVGSDWTGADPTTLDEFLTGTTTDGCIAGCEASPALIAVIDPTNCPVTTGTVSSVNPDFAESCIDVTGEGGAPAGGSGGAPAGGSGGAPAGGSGGAPAGGSGGAPAGGSGGA
jgi:hypothetical protein